MKKVEELRKAAEHYRRLADSFTDRKTIDALNELAAEYEATAARLETEQGAFAEKSRPEKKEGSS